MNEIFYRNNGNRDNFDKSIKKDKGIKNMNNNNNKERAINGMVNVSGIILSGNGPLKSQLYQSPFLKHYISSSIISIVDINYGGKFGFHETIKKCSSLLKQNELESENKLIENLMNLIANDNDNNDGNIISIGFNETLYAIKLAAVKYIVLTSGYYKYAVKLMIDHDDDDDDEQKKDEKDKPVVNGKIMKQVRFVKNDIELNEISKIMLSSSLNKDKNVNIEIESFIRFWDNLCDENNVELNLVGIHSPITSQFAKGLSGCVAVLHYAINLQNNDQYDDDDDEWFEE